MYVVRLFAPQPQNILFIMKMTFVLQTLSLKWNEKNNLLMVFHVFYKVIANLPWINNGINIKAEINLKNKGYTDALMDRTQI